MKWSNLPYLGQYLAQRLEEHKAYVNLGWAIYKNYKRNKETKEINLHTLGTIKPEEHVELIKALGQAQVLKQKEATTRYLVTDRAALLLRFASFGYKLMPLVHNARALAHEPFAKYFFWFYKGNHSFLLVDNYNGQESLVLYYAYLTNANFRVKFSEPITWHQCARIPHLQTQAGLVYDIIDEAIAHHESFYQGLQQAIGVRHIGVDEYDELQEALINLRLATGESKLSMYRRFARKVNNASQGVHAYMRMRDALYMPINIGKNKYKKPVWGELITLDKQFLSAIKRYYA
jgi:hypothetical protein